MPTIKIIVLTIVATFVLYGNIKIITAQEFGVQQFLGRWYEIGRITPPYAPPIPVTCGRYDITRRSESANGFNENYKFSMGKFPIYYDGYGQITGYEMNITIPTLEQVNHIHNFANYNGGTELIINKKDEKKYYGMISRKVVVSESTKAVFEDLAAAVGVKPYYVPHIQCEYN